MWYNKNGSQLKVHYFRLLTNHTSNNQMLVELSDIVGSLSLSDLNKVLYRCNEEESDQGFGGGVYVVPTTGAMVYCGLQGMMN